MMGSYGFNGWLYRAGIAIQADDDALLANAGSGVTGWSVTRARDSLWQLPVASASGSDIPTFSDSNWIDGWPHEVDQPPQAPYTLITGQKNSVEAMRRICLSRHGKKQINVVFVDGHAATTDLIDLWKLKWHRGWATPDPLPTLPQ
jgi:prepilin-type processing-associated H-X9-DG protein